MFYKKPIVYTALAFSMFGLAACSQNSEPTAEDQPAVVANKAVPAREHSSSPGKPTAPIDIRYEVIGKAIVGLPVSINVFVTSDLGPVKVEYSINDGSALMFQSGQVKSLEIADPSTGNMQQLSVIPQREGRVYVNVSAEIQTPDGLNIRSMAIPIKVGGAPEKAIVNGERVEGPGGETVISMPAEESN
jgi:hypothetical protein